MRKDAELNKFCIFVKRSCRNIKKLFKLLSEKSAHFEDRGFLHLTNLFIMIYKFRKEEQNCVLEIEPIFNEAPIDIVELSIIAESGTRSISLYKDDVYKLIGALHLLHKEMK